MLKNENAQTPPTLHTYLKFITEEYKEFVKGQGDFAHNYVYYCYIFSLIYTNILLLIYIFNEHDLKERLIPSLRSASV